MDLRDEGELIRRLQQHDEEPSRRACDCTKTKSTA